MQMPRVLCALHKQCDKWPDHGKQPEPSWVDLYYVLKNNQWCLGCGHVFCLTTNSIMCKEKHDCESIELKGNIYMKDDLLGCQK